MSLWLRFSLHLHINIFQDWKESALAWGGILEENEIAMAMEMRSLEQMSLRFSITYLS